MVLVEVTLLLDLASLSTPPPSRPLQETGSTYARISGTGIPGALGIVGNVVRSERGVRQLNAVEAD